MLEKHPVYWDETIKSGQFILMNIVLKFCKNPEARIPVINPNNEQKLNEYALEILQ